jgi:2-keto-3-deoxy-L-rhamnonate aldolase RhmA
VVPQVRSAEEVRSVVSDCRYPPLGRRGYGPRVPSNYGRDGGDEYVERANRGIFVAVQIETAEALEALDDILAVPGLDSIVLGPWDLSGALGVLGNVEHPRVVAAIETIISKARAAGLAVGSGMGPDPDYAYVMAQRGVQWIQIGGDYGYLVRHMDQITTSVRGRLTNEPMAGG